MLIYFYIARNNEQRGFLKNKISTLFFVGFVLFYFIKSGTNILRMRKKREILFNFWLAEKIQKHMKSIFLKKERKKERLKSKRSLLKTIAEQ